jgi:hypothetical protein
MLKVLKHARTALTHLNPEQIRKLAGRLVRVGLVAPTGAAYAEMEDFLIPRSAPHEAQNADVPACSLPQG